MNHTPFVDKLYRQAVRHYRLRLWGALFTASLLVLFSWLGMALLDSIVHFSRVSRWGFFSLQLSFMFYLMAYRIYPAWRDGRLRKKSASLKTFARLADKLTGSDDLWLNTVELSEQHNKEGDADPYREAAIGRLIPRCDFNALQKALPLKRYMPAPALPIVFLLSAALLGGLIGRPLGVSALRMVAPWAAFFDIPAYTMDVKPGTATVYRGEDLTIRAVYRGPRAEGLRLWRREGREARPYPMIKKDNNRFTVVLKNNLNDFRYWVQAADMENDDYAGRIVSDTFRVDVLEPPFVKNLRMEVIPPPYSKLPRQAQGLNDTRFSLLPGSELYVKLTANKALRAAGMVFDDSSRFNLQVHNFNAEGRRVFMRGGQFRFSLLSMDSLVNRGALRYRVEMLEDRPPYVEITAPGMDIEAQPEDILPIEVLAGDDFGVAGIVLYYRHIASGDTGLWQKKPFSIKENEGQSHGRILFDFSEKAIAYGDQMEYFAQAMDGNNVSGPGVARSARYKVLFPSLDDLFEDFAEKTEERNDDMEDMARRSEDLKKTLEEIHRDLKRTEKMDWKTKKRIEHTLDEQKKLREKVEKIEQELQKMVEQLEDREILSEEMLRKYQQLQDMFRQIAPPELMEAMQKLQQAMEKSNPREVEKALRSLKENQENFKQNLERTLELFKQIQMEQQLDRLAQQARELAEKQQQIGERLEKKEEGTAGMQEQQTRQLKNMERSLDDMLQNPRLQSFRESAKGLNEARKEMERTQMAARSEEIKKALQQGEREQAAQQSAELQQNMRSMQERLQGSLDNMRQSHKQKVQSKMLAVTRDLLKLSFEQERLQRQSRNASRVDDQLREIARKQSRIQQNLQKTIGEMIELSKQTFFMEQSLNRDMARAQSQMRKSLDDLSERRAMPAAQSQRQAMEALNRGVQGMQRSLNRLGKSPGGTGFEQLMEQLKQMAGMQGNLNGETMGLFNAQQGNRGRLSPEQQGLQKRLAARQQALQQAMREIAGEMGNRGDVLGRLGQLSEEMEKVVQDLLKKGISRKTVERQQRILSRMLDAQKSVREREYSKKRKAQKAKRYQAVDPGRLSPAENAYLKQLQEALRNSYREGYAPEYQRSIEAYIRKLIREKQQGNGETSNEQK